MKRLILAAAAALILSTGGAALAQDVTKYVRYDFDGAVSYGILDGGFIHQLRGDVFAGAERTGAVVALDAVRLLVPVEPRKVVAAGFNYRSHLGDQNVRARAGVVRQARDVARAPRGDRHLLRGRHQPALRGRDGAHHRQAGAQRDRGPRRPTTSSRWRRGNDISERVWLGNDLQWFRAKGADTFGPVGPVMARGVDYNDLLLQTRVNGEVMQSQRTKDLIFGPEFLVSYVSRYVTLEPGDMIFTGTPGSTSAMQPGRRGRDRARGTSACCATRSGRRARGPRTTSEASRRRRAFPSAGSAW